MARVAYKNQPKGMGSITTNINRKSEAVDLDSLLIFGNRAQRRFAKKQIAELRKREGINHGSE